MIRRIALTLALLLAAAIVAPTGAEAGQPLNQAGLDGLGGCEADSSGGYQAATGNGYYGRFQFVPSTWDWVIGAMVEAGVVDPNWARWANVLPHEAPPGVQDMAAVWLWNNEGPHHWPVCQWAALDAMGSSSAGEVLVAPVPVFAG